MEILLYRRGFRSPASRRILALQLTVAGAALLTGAAALHVSLWPMAFGVGAALVACNLWWLTRSVEWSMARRYSALLAAAAAASFLFRFGLMALALYGALVWLALPAVPLLAGLSTVMPGLVWQGIIRMRQTVKEA
jgi:hypothetical protein